MVRETKWAIIKETETFPFGNEGKRIKYILADFDTLDEAYEMLKSVGSTEGYIVDERTFSAYKTTYRNEYKMYIRQIDYPIEQAKEKLWQDITMEIFKLADIIKDVDEQQYNIWKERSAHKDSFSAAENIVEEIQDEKDSAGALGSFIEKYVFHYFKDIREKNNRLIPNLLTLQNKCEFLYKEDQK